MSTHQHQDPGLTEAPKQGGCGGGGDCGCGGNSGTAALPEFDATVVPPALRHASIFGALDSIQPGGGMVLVAPHDPLPLLAQVEQRTPGRFTVEYVERGPAWKLAFLRTGA